MKLLPRRALVALMSLGLLALPMAAPAHAADTQMPGGFREVSFRTHYASVRTFKEAGTNKLYSIINVTVGSDVPHAHCVEVFTNVNLTEHRSSDMTIACRTFTSLVNHKVYLLRQNGQQAYASQWDMGEQHKGVKLCVIGQAYNYRHSSTPNRCSTTWTGSYDGISQGNAEQPFVDQYDGKTLDDMSTALGSNNIRSFSGWADRQWVNPSGNVYLNQHSMWTSWGCSASLGCTSRYLFIFQEDGNLVMYRVKVPSEPGGPGLVATWNSGTAGWWWADLVIQPDGNMVIYGDPAVDPQCVWATGLWGRSVESYAQGGNGGNYGVTTAGAWLTYAATYC